MIPLVPTAYKQDCNLYSPWILTDEVVFENPSMSKFTAQMDEFLSDKVLASQRHDWSIINEWVKFMNGEKAILKAGEADVWRYLSYQRGKKGHISRLDGTTEMSWTTINAKFQLLRNMYNYLISIKECKTNPFLDNKFDFSKKRSPEKRPTQLVPFDLVPKIIAVPGTGNKDGVRDTAFLTILFSTGCRKNEVSSLNLSDIRETAKGTLYLRIVRSKNGTARKQALPTWSHAAIKALVDQRIKEGAVDTDKLFMTYVGPRSQPTRPASSRTLCRVYEHACFTVGLGEGYTLHSARATVITKAIEDGIPHHRVQEISGHRSIQMVEHYYKKFREVDESAGLMLNFDKK